jgi:hypothetical protein
MPISWIGTLNAGDFVQCRMDSGGANTQFAQGSEMSIKRLQ